MTPTLLATHNDLLERLAIAKPRTQNPAFIATLLSDAKRHLEALEGHCEALEKSEKTLVARVQELERKPKR